MGVVVFLTPAVATLHCAHNVSGLRAGTLPGVVQQNAFLGLPLTLTSEESAYLVSTGVAHLVPLATRPTTPSPAVVAERTRTRIERNTALALRMREEDAKRAQASKDKYAGSGGEKRAARGRKRAEEARNAALAAGEDEAVVQARYEAALAAVEAASAPKTVEPASTKPGVTPTAENTNLFTVVPARPVHPSLLPSAAVGLRSQPFPFPKSPRDNALMGTFGALQRRGLRMGLGPRFGGEWLVYPGDYLRYHAHFTSQVLVNDEPLMPAQIVAWGRLGTGTKKAGLICCWGGEGGDEEEGGEGDDVEFYSLEWSNFG